MNNNYINDYCIICGSHFSFKTNSYILMHERTDKHQQALLVSKTLKFEDNKINCPCSDYLIKIDSLDLHKTSQKHKRYIKKFNNNEELKFD